MGYFREAVLLVGHLWNLTLSCSLPSRQTPFEMLHKYKSDLSHLRVFGARCFARVPLELHRTTNVQSVEAVFMGYPDGVKGWRLHNALLGAFFNSCDVKFDKGSILLPHDSSLPMKLGSPSTPSTPMTPSEEGDKAIDPVLPHCWRNSSLSSLSSLSTLTDSEDEEAPIDRDKAFAAQAAFIITEQVNLSIRSDVQCDPGQTGYDMDIPPATYDEAM